MTQDVLVSPLHICLRLFYLHFIFNLIYTAKRHYFSRFLPRPSYSTVKQREPIWANGFNHHLTTEDSQIKCLYKRPHLWAPNTFIQLCPLYLHLDITNPPQVWQFQNKVHFVPSPQIDSTFHVNYLREWQLSSKWLSESSFTTYQIQPTTSPEDFTF